MSWDCKLDKVKTDDWVWKDGETQIHTVKSTLKKIRNKIIWECEKLKLTISTPLLEKYTWTKLLRETIYSEKKEE